MYIAIADKPVEGRCFFYIQIISRGACLWWDSLFWRFHNASKHHNTNMYMYQIMKCWKFVKQYFMAQECPLQYSQSYGLGGQECRNILNFGGIREAVCCVSFCALCISML